MNPISNYKFHILDDLDGGGHLAISAIPGRGLARLTTCREGDSATVKIGDLAKVLGLTGLRPDWLEAEVIYAELDGELDGERVFAVRDEDGDWLIYGGLQDGQYVLAHEAEANLSNVEIVKA